MPSTDTQFKKGHKLNVGKTFKMRDDYHGNSTSFKKGQPAWNKDILSPWAKDLPQNFKKGQIPWNKGRKETRLEVLENQRKVKLGIKPTLETRKKLSFANKGEKSYLWKGGITSLVKFLRNCFEYRQWRSDIYLKDNFTCQSCGKKGGNLEAHHIKSFALILHENNIKTVEEALNCAELWNINNGITLCIPCHQLTDNYGKPKKNV